MDRGDSTAAPPLKRLRSDREKFNFHLHCIYCGEECNIVKDRKNPTRWREAYICKARYSETVPYKDYIINLCLQRDDCWGEEVRLRISGVISDMSAAGARYHKDCLARFLTTTKRKSTPKKEGIENVDENAIKLVVETMLSNKEKVWESTEIYSLYRQHTKTDTSRHSIMEALRRHLKDKIGIFSSPGCPRVIAFQSEIAKKLLSSERSDDFHVEKVARMVKDEITKLDLDTHHYNLDVCTDNASSGTLRKLMMAISPKFEHSLSFRMIGNIVTSLVKSHSTDLQIALGVLLRNSKSLINAFHDFGVTCSYDETLRFRRSAATSAVSSKEVQGISPENNGMIQVIVDNFDADISSQNGKVSTHSLAMILTQPECESAISAPQTTITRLDRSCRRLPVEDISEIAEYTLRERKPAMPEQTFDLHALPSTEEMQVITKAEDTDFDFLRDIVTTPECPEFNGYNVKIHRSEGTKNAPKTNVAYMPLIDNPPSAPSTMMTAMLKAREICNGLGQKFVVLTADMQLYKIAVHIKWENKELFSNVYLRLGGMHTLMSYVGSIGTLMAGSGLDEILTAGFGGVQKMLSGKKFPQNVRALRLLVEELLRPIFENDQKPKSMIELKRMLNERCEKSKTAKMWTTVVIYPMLTIMKFMRAEKESNWLLHLSSLREMRPLFVAANHSNYAMQIHRSLFERNGGAPCTCPGTFLEWRAHVSP
jgi:hypothetical protein